MLTRPCRRCFSRAVVWNANSLPLHGILDAPPSIVSLLCLAYGWLVARWSLSSRASSEFARNCQQYGEYITHRKHSDVINRDPDISPQTFPLFALGHNFNYPGHHYLNTKKIKRIKMLRYQFRVSVRVSNMVSKLFSFKW